eukprot:gb/GECH01012220.1/.p1 GENE.gb/GECH01012220.1/~~gb/GECH01012220.1/.p1  ORF type:complete len:561 (+),score=154.25 gb/GECH01012220.1/:1-1683(+)
MTFQIKSVDTQPIAGQKTGTSGLRKKTQVVTQEENYLQNWVQSLFHALPQNKLNNNTTLVLGGDGRYYNREAAQIIIRMAAANGVGRVLVGQHGLLSTPAVSAIIRKRGAYGGLIMTASHNPGGPDEDWGIKYNTENGGPAPESVTNEIFKQTESITSYKIADLPEIDLSKIESHQFGDFKVEVIDPVSDLLEVYSSVFDMDAIKQLIRKNGFSMLFDALHGVTGIYAEKIFCDELGAPKNSIVNCTPKEDFGGGHPDPNLTYAASLVNSLYQESGPDFGAASDGDGDRNMILGKQFFVTPSDSVAIIADYAQKCIPYFKNGLKGLARSMPTSKAIDRVASKHNVSNYEVPTGWKFFGSLMDANMLSICGEESFGTGSDHIREKDGLWAVLAWLSILAYRNKENDTKVTVKDIVEEHWQEFGRSFYCRYDFEQVASEGANQMMDHLREQVSGALNGKQFKEDGQTYTVSACDEFEYTDQVTRETTSKQGIRIHFDDGSRLVFRLSGTGSSGATIRLYMEQYSKDQLEGNSPDKVKPLASIAMKVAKIQEFTGRDKPTVIT